MNKYKNAQLFEVPESPEPKGIGVLDLTGGLDRSRSPREIDLGMTQRMDNVRFERNGIRKDFGDRGLGASAPNNVLCLIEHKFIDTSGVQWSYFIRLLRHADGRAKTQVYNVSTEEWEDDSLTTSVTIENNLVRGISVRGVLLFACYGSGILQREEIVLYDAEYNDFPNGNSLTGTWDYTELTVTPSDVVKNNEFTVYYDVDLTLTTGVDLSVSVGLYIDDILKATEIYEVAAPGSDSWPGETFVFEEELESGAIVKLKITEVSIDSANTPRNISLSDIGGTPRWQGTKSQAAESYNEEYTYSFYIRTDEEIRIRFYVDKGAGWVEAGPYIQFMRGYDGYIEHSIVATGMGAGSKFGIHVLTILGDPPVHDIDEYNGGVEVDWEESTGDYDIDVHGYNLPTDGDSNHGIEYEARSGKTVTLEPISGSPEATWIESFGDRIIALRDGGDTQQFSASADGDHENWTTEDSVETILVDTRNDPIDDLQCAGPLASNILAVIRSRSIMRSFETGNYDLAVGVNHWLEGVGTESPHSIAITPAGLIFLGHDYMVYALNEGGLYPVGINVQSEIIEGLTDNLHLVDGVYDPIYKEYWLGIPEGGEEYMTAIYIFDVGEFVSSGGKIARWRKKLDNIRRFAIIGSEV